ncbi:MAG: hypothetical protein IPG58_02360 [Acidobacteria bacterium]|nr:hypothetical protein [Acidobacteriota bacterium]MBP7475268.1 hypothetical protein [Pyrinomonadaceae bacterium]
MNVFEDLVTELQEENLLEQTVIGDRPHSRRDSFDLEQNHPEQVHFVSPQPEQAPRTEVQIETAADFAVAAMAEPVEKAPEYTPQNLRQRNNKEFFKKRAMTEVSSLQIVEHIITGVEREYLKVVPKAYDDFKAKKALNNFLQIPDGVNTEEHAEAEFELLQQTEAWCSALAERDKNVPVSALRQFCENTRPALSSQALLAAARFYRNLPYSEGVRSKFDFVITRLFSRANENEQRVALFSREETLNHIKKLYAEWSSVPLYATNDDDTDVVLAALSFDDLAIESENAASFDQLIQTNFFGRLREFKESISELFFAPSVTAAAIDANVRIGNSYVKLISFEREKMDSDTIQSKYAEMDGDVVSDATARTLELVDVLKAPRLERQQDEANVDTDESRESDYQGEPPEKIVQSKKKADPRAMLGGIKEQILGFNKWVLIGCALLVLATGGLVVWSNYFAKPSVSNAGVVAVDFANPTIDAHIEKAKVSNTMLYAQMKESWETLPKEKRLEILKMMYDGGATRGFNQVNLIDKDGKAIGFASPNRLEVPNL